jgi:diacylglycerol kinase (ATP)
MSEYAIVANPVAGRMARPKSLDRLKNLAELLSCPLLGMDLKSIDDFRSCLAELSRSCRVLLIAGGDGTFAEALNSLRAKVTLGFLPFGTGNALNYALGKRCSSPKYVQSIIKQNSIPIRVMRCNGHRLSLMAGIGLDAEAMRCNQRLKKEGPNSLISYGKSFARALKNCPAADLEITSGAKTYHSRKNLSAIVTKHPFFGYGLKVSNQVNLTEPNLSLRLVEGSRIGALGQLAASMIFRRAVGARIKTGDSFSIKADKERWLQCDGDLIESGREFKFELLSDTQQFIY